MNNQYNYPTQSSSPIYHSQPTTPRQENQFADGYFQNGSNVYNQVAPQHPTQGQYPQYYHGYPQQIPPTYPQSAPQSPIQGYHSQQDEGYFQQYNPSGNRQTPPSNMQDIYPPQGLPTQQPMHAYLQQVPYPSEQLSHLERGMYPQGYPPQHLECHMPPQQSVYKPVPSPRYQPSPKQWQNIYEQPRITEHMPPSNLQYNIPIDQIQKFIEEFNCESTNESYVKQMRSQMIAASRNNRQTLGILTNQLINKYIKNLTHCGELKFPIDILNSLKKYLTEESFRDIAYSLLLCYANSILNVDANNIELMIRFRNIMETHIIDFVKSNKTLFNLTQCEHLLKHLISACDRKFELQGKLAPFYPEGAKTLKEIKLSLNK